MFENSYGYHPRCRRIKLSYLCFADDLMIFCKGDISSVKVVCNRIQTFSNTSGLQANSNKFAVYTAGVHPEIKEAIGQLT